MYFELMSKKGLYISGDNTGDKANLDFFSDVNKFSKLYDYIICTPSVSTGVSISNNHFDFIMQDGDHTPAYVDQELKILLLDLQLLTNDLRSINKKEKDED